MREGPVHEYKIKEVEQTAKLLESKPVVGIINLSNLPSSQFQAIRKKFRGKAEIKTIKANYLVRAFEKVKNPELKKLKEYVTGSSALIVSDENPFKLYSFMKKNRSKASAKAGMVADKDIVVPAGETELPVGPALSELKMVKIDCKVQNQKIFINKDSTVARKGDVITQQLSGVLSKLGIMPVEIGLTLSAVFENGLIYKSEDLDVDEELFMQNLQSSFVKALNLSVNAGYPTKQNMPFMIQKAYNNARSLAIEAKIYTQESMPPIK